MDNKAKLFLLFSSFLLVLIGYWGIQYNYAYINIISNQSNYNLSIGQNNHDCLNSCSIKIKPGIYTAVITKDGYQPFETKLFVSRGKTYSIDYNPIFIPEFKLVEVESLALYTIQSLDSGAQQISILNSDGQYLPVSTFRLPLAMPKITVSSDLMTSLIWSSSDPVEIYLINNLQQSRQKLTLPEQFDTIQDLKLISSNYLAIQSDGVYLYDLKSEILIPIPTNSIEYIQLLSASSILFFSSQNLTNAPNSFTDFTQISNLVDKQEEELASELLLPADKIYSFNLTTGQSTFLGLIPPNITEPFRFETILINQTPQQILTTQEESFLVINSPN